jgi:hypothetical protein
MRRTLESSGAEIRFTSGAAVEPRTPYKNATKLHPGLVSFMLKNIREPNMTLWVVSGSIMNVVIQLTLRPEHIRANGN